MQVLASISKADTDVRRLAFTILGNTANHGIAQKFSIPYMLNEKCPNNLVSSIMLKQTEQSESSVACVGAEWHTQY
jgi:hypothetical protein